MASFNITNFTVTAGVVTTSTQTLTAGTGLAGGGTISLGAGALTIALSTPVTVPNGGTGDTSLTLNGVLFGNGTSSVGVTAQGATNTVLLGNGGVPSFGAVPAGALPGNGQITLANGTNISVSGSPVSLGGTATISVSGPITPITYTTNGVLYGNATGALQVTAQGAANTVLLGNGGVPSFGQVPNGALQNSSITFTAGTNVTFNVASPATIALGGALTINASTSGGGGSSAVVSFYEEFAGNIFSASGKNLFVGQTSWTYNLAGSGGSTAISIIGTGTNPGILNFNMEGTGILCGAFLSASPLRVGVLPGQGANNSTFIVALPSVSTLTNFIGFGTTFPLSSGPAIYFGHNRVANGGFYTCVSTISFGNAGITTTVNTTTPIGGGPNGFDKLQIQINAAGTSIAYLINGVTVATIITNIPTSLPMSPLVYTTGSSSLGNAFILQIDEFDMQITLATPR